jgi:hypothetical protein
MPDKGRMASISRPEEVLIRRQSTAGGWSSFESTQISVEATCLALLALSPLKPDAGSSPMDRLLRLQHHDGGWPAFSGDEESSWTTALALNVLNITSEAVSAREQALHWLIEGRGREANWLWRWKFRIADRDVRFNPHKYGWPWSPKTVSWVIPSAFSLVAIKQYTACNRLAASEERIRLGVEMLLDRACVVGGWNSGNSIVYGVPLPPHVEATAIALLALQDEERTPIIRMSLAWLKQRSATIEAVESLAWSILSLFVYQEPVEDLKARLATLIGDGREIRNNATLATAILALRCGEMIHPFVVLR